MKLSCWTADLTAEFKAEMVSRYNLSEPPLEGTMYAYKTIDYWIMIDMIGFTAEWYWTQVENPLSGAKRLPLGVMPQSKGGLPPLYEAKGEQCCCDVLPGQ